MTKMVAEIRNSTLITRLLNLADDDFDNFDFSTDEDDMFINASQKKKQGDSHLHVLRLLITIVDIRKIHAQKFGQQQG